MEGGLTEMKGYNGGAGRPGRGKDGGGSSKLNPYGNGLRKSVTL